MQSAQHLRRGAQPARELELVRWCARVDPDDATVERIRNLAHDDLAWDVVVEQAIANSTLPLLHRTLATYCAESVPDHWRRELEDHFRANAAANERLAEALVGILGCFSERGIAAIPFKGQVLAATAYGDLSLREQGDLDIVVAPADAGAAAALLAECGFRTVKELGWQATFVDPDGLVTVDLHRSLSEPRFPVRFDFDDLWDRRRTVTLSGRLVPSLDPEDTLLVLCWQLVKDGWDRHPQLARVADLAQVQRAWPTMDMAAVADRAARVGVRRAVHVALRVAHRMLAAPLPPAAVVSKSDRHVVPVLQDRILDGVFAHDTARSRHQGQRRFHFLLRERARDKVYPYFYLPYFWRAYILPALAPSERDQAVVALPRALSFLYLVVRPVRVLGERRARGRRRVTALAIRRVPDVDVALVDGQATLLDEDGHAIVTLNAIGTLVWDELAESRTPESLARELAPRFDGVTEEQLERDIFDFVDSLRDLGFVVDEPAPSGW